MAEVKIKPVAIRDFHTGVVQGIENPRMPHSAVREAINCHFDNISSVELRPGITRLGNQITGSGNVLSASPDGDTVDGWVGYNRVQTVYDTFTDPDVDTDKWAVTGETAVVSEALHLIASQFVTYDDFSGSKDTTKFNFVSGTSEITGGRLRLWGDTNHTSSETNVTTDGKTPAGLPSGDDIKGIEFYWRWDGGGPEGLDRFAGLKAGSDVIELKSEHAAGGLTRLQTSGAYGSGTLFTTPAKSGTLKILQEGPDIKCYWNGNLVGTRASKTITSNSYFFAKAQIINGSNNFLEVDNIKLITSATSTASTDGKTNGDPIKGLKWDQTHVGGLNSGGGTIYSQLTDDTSYIRVAHDITDETIDITSSGASYGSTSTTGISSAGGTLEIVEDGSDIVVKLDGVIKHTISDKKIADASHLEATASTTTPGGDHYLKIDNVETTIGTSDTLSNVRDANGTTADDTENTADVVKITASTTTDEFSEIRRGILVFDTSSIPDSAVIDSVVLKLYVNTVTEDLASQSLSVVKASTSSNTALKGSDYQSMGDDKLASDTTLASLTETAVNSITLNATGEAHINKKSLTKIGLRLSGDVDDSAPTWSSGDSALVNINMSGSASNKPILEVTYTVGNDINGLHQFLDAGDGTFNRLVTQAGGVHYYYDTDTETWTSVDTDRSDSVKERYLNALGYMFVTNPEDGIETWTGNVDGLTYPLSSTNLVGRWKMDASANSTEPDASTNSNDLTDGTTGIASDADAKDGTSRLLVAADSDYFYSADTADHSLTGAMTFGGWFQFVSLAGDMVLIQKFNTTGDERSYGLTVDSSGEITLSISSDGTSANTTSISTTTAELVIDTWYRIVGVYNPSTRMEIFVNGVSFAFSNTDIPASIYDSTAQFEVGRNQGGTDDFLDAYVDEVFLMDTNWTASQVRTDHNSYTPTSFGTVNAVGAPKAHFLEFYKSQVYAARTDEHPDRVFKSSIPSLAGAITWTPEEDYIDVNPSDGENLTGMRRLAVELLFFKRNYLYRYYGVEGTDPDPIINIGTYSNESIVVAKNGAYFHHPSGFYLYGGGQPQEISRPIKDFVTNIDRTEFDRISGWNDPDHVYESVGDVTIGDVTFENVVCRYTISNQVWTIYSYPQAQMLRGISYDTGSLIEQVVADSNSSVHQFNTGTTDNNDPIFYSLKTKWYELNSIAEPFTITQLAAICSLAQGVKLSYQINDWPDNRWESIATLNEYRWTSNKNLKLAGHRISFRIHGSSEDTRWVFAGIEILDGIVHALPTRD